MTENFGNYEIIKKLAAGGMAEVLLAKQTGVGGFERLVCLKRILPHLSANEDFVKMFQDEARIAASLIHPNIGQIYEIGQVGDNFFIAMEYVRGEDLRRIYNQEVKRGQALPVEIAAVVAAGAAAALEFAHRQSDLDGRPLGIVHRDVSPQNILLTYDGFVKLIDFGVAKAAGKMMETRSGVLKGKYSYMSPEQAQGEPVDGRTDVFALGITLYEVTTGTRLFKRDSELETLQAVIACNVKPPSEIIPGYDPDFEHIVMTALQADPNQRYQSAMEMELMIEKYIYDKGIPNTASALSAYMQELFHEKLAEEMGMPATEASLSNIVVSPESKASAAQTEQVTVLAGRPTPPDAPAPDASDVDDGGWQQSDESGSFTSLRKWYQPKGLAELVEAAKAAESAQEAPSEVAADKPAKNETAAPLEAPRPSALSTFGQKLGKQLRRKPSLRFGKRLVGAALIGLALLGIAGAGLWMKRHVEVPKGLINRTVNRAVELSDKASSAVRDIPKQVESATADPAPPTPPPTPTPLPLGPHGSLAIAAEPWAWVQIDTQTPFEAPAQVDVAAGQHTVLYECPDGRRFSESVNVAEEGVLATKIVCTE